jgi:hypothetical protein
MAQASVNTEQKSKNQDCYRTIFVQSPVSDTYVTRDRDTFSFGKEPTLRLRGLPEKKSMISLLSYEVHDLDAAYVSASYLKIYTVSKKEGHEIILSSVASKANELTTRWVNQPSAGDFIEKQVMTDAPFVIFNVTEYIKGHLKNGFLDFNLQTNSKKPIDIASRESGLSAELIIEMCTPVASMGLTDPGKEKDRTEWSLKVLPSDLEGKFTIQLVGVPEGGYADLMLMTEQGDIVRQIPIAIQNAPISYHILDLGALLPGIYWAVLRKGRVIIRDQFRLRPAASGSMSLQVDLEDFPKKEP